MVGLGIGARLSALRHPAICFKTIRQPSPSFGPCTRRQLSTSRSFQERLGKITPKRIAIPLGSSPGIVSDGTGPSLSIWRPIIFCLVLGGGAYAGAAIYTNAETDTWARRLGDGAWWRRGTSGRASDSEIFRAKRLDQAKEAQQTINTITSNITFLPKFLQTIILRTSVMILEGELNTPPATLVPLEIIGTMAFITLAWRGRRTEGFMRRWFLHRPVVFSTSAKKKWQESITLFTSILSHQTLPHLAFNCLALYSFGGAAYSFLSAPPPGTTPLLSSTYTPHFLAFLLAAGLTSSLASHLWTNLFRLPRLLRALANPARISSPQALAAHEAILPSLGASGAIYAAVTLTACAYPNSGVSLIFFPFFAIPIGMGVGGMVMLDVIGLIRGWKMFDHVAHLGGALFGVIYYSYGRQAWVWVRRTLGGERKPVTA
ncbi:hypothetical protein BD324DRAFT_647404 [Kockovaella imperatae]|uniref:Peptidase S54 rhomboid domain-containing protein n=1 Tax=Kockovaella imperatae TaxID=4999 RepID=A0A1Y1USG7_9TREE|nr:hypothetical protein BD324DRAFT_647404 [Kockovaella imperatae]ORX40474.1 hypothetical protein BD324DRAFT_647404 [Kockovaella imperatae]